MKIKRRADLRWEFIKEKKKVGTKTRKHALVQEKKNLFEKKTRSRNHARDQESV